jgi:hypothetical protein
MKKPCSLFSSHNSPVNPTALLQSQVLGALHTPPFKQGFEHTGV